LTNDGHEDDSSSTADGLASEQVDGLSSLTHSAATASVPSTTEEEAAPRLVSLDAIEDILLSATDALDATTSPKFELAGMAAECVWHAGLSLLLLLLCCCCCCY
jgi:hypothetical protein